MKAKKKQILSNAEITKRLNALYRKFATPRKSTRKKKRKAPPITNADRRKMWHIKANGRHSKWPPKKTKKRVTRVKRNPAKAYVIKGNFFGEKISFYWDGFSFGAAKQDARKYRSKERATEHAEYKRDAWKYAFPNLHTISVTPA